VAEIYHQRHPEQTVFYRVLFNYFDEFVAEYENRFEREYGYFRPVIQEVVEKYFDCGNPKCGFARIRCPDCGTESGKETLVKYFKAVAGRELTPGIIAVIQSFGSRINFHQHLHFLVFEGGSDREGLFHSIFRFNDDLLREIFTREVFSLLLRKQLINLTLIEKILRWRHTDFHVHSKVRATNKQEAERVGKYMIRPILSLKRLYFDEAQGQVIYQYGKHSSKLERMDYLEFIARVTSHIPDKGQVMIRYHGLYANAHRGKKRKTGEDPSHPPIIDDEVSFVPSKGWAEMIRKVFEVDPLLCPSCGGQMSIISFIEDHKVIDKIIDHLKLTFMAERPPPFQVVQQELLMAAEERGEYF